MPTYNVLSEEILEQWKNKVLVDADVTIVYK